MGGKRKTYEDPDTGEMRRLCRHCLVDFPLSAEFFAIKSRGEQGEISGFTYECKPCAVVYKQGLIDHLRETNPQGYRRHREKAQAVQRRWRANNPAEAAALTKGYQERLRADPERHVRYLETRRIAYRLKAEREGRPVKQVRYGKKLDEPRTLPAGPLADLIERIYSERVRIAEVIFGELPSLREVCEDLGTTERTWRHWRRGNGATVQLALADRVLMNADVDFSSVYSYDDHANSYIVAGQTPAMGVGSDESAPTTASHGLGA